MDAKYEKYANACSMHELIALVENNIKNPEGMDDVEKLLTIIIGNAIQKARKAIVEILIPSLSTDIEVKDTATFIDNTANQIVGCFYRELQSPFLLAIENIIKEDGTNGLKVVEGIERSANLLWSSGFMKQLVEGVIAAVNPVKPL